jgi:hypothetical protein
MRQAIQFISEALWRWEVVGVGSTLIYGFAVGAMYAEDYIVAASLYFLGVTWLTAKILAWEETTNHPQGHVISAVVLVLAVAILAASLLWIQHTKKLHPQEVKESFIVSDPRSIINMKRDVFASLPFWVRYISAYGDTISPVAVISFIDITSNVSTPEKVKDYSVAIKTAECGWVYLVPIRMRSVKVLFIPLGGIQKAILLNFTTNGLDYLLENPIPPFGTVSGWLLFDTRVKCNIGIGESFEYRFSFETFSGQHFEVTKTATISNANLNPGNSIANMTGPTFVTVGAIEDLSKSFIRFYSDEIP